MSPPAEPLDIVDLDVLVVDRDQFFISQCNEFPVDALPGGSYYLGEFGLVQLSVDCDIAVFFMAEIGCQGGLHRAESVSGVAQYLAAARVADIADRAVYKKYPLTGRLLGKPECRGHRDTVFTSGAGTLGNQAEQGTRGRNNTLVIDIGAHQFEKDDDYPDFAEAVGRAVVAGEGDRGILICGSGVGACIAANKIKGVRACLCHDIYSAVQGVEHDDMNVLCLGGQIVGPELANRLALAYLEANFFGSGRFLRRVEKILKLEE